MNSTDGESRLYLSLINELTCVSHRGGFKAGWAVRYLQEDSGEVVEDRLKELQAKGPGHLRHAHQPVGGVCIHELAQVLNTQ